MKEKQRQRKLDRKENINTERYEWRRKGKKDEEGQKVALYCVWNKRNRTTDTIDLEEGLADWLEYLMYFLHFVQLLRTSGFATTEL